MIKVYGTTNCAHCQTAKDYLKSKGTDFEYIDLLTQTDKIDEVLKITDGQIAVPVICSDKGCIVGFNKADVDKLL